MRKRWVRKSAGKSGLKSGLKKRVLLAGTVAAFTLGSTGSAYAAEFTDETAGVYEEAPADEEESEEKQDEMISPETSEESDPEVNVTEEDPEEGMDDLSDEAGDLTDAADDLSDYMDEPSEEEIITGWYQEEGFWYYADEEGNPVRDQVIVSDGKRYYLDDEGRMATDTVIAIEDKLYYANAKGVIRTTGGWFSWQGDWYYADIDCSLYQNRLVQKKGISWYMGPDGRMVTDQAVQIMVDGVPRRYRAGSDGVLVSASGWLKVDKDWYYIGADGIAVCDDEVTDNGKTYRMDPSGHLLTETVVTGKDGALHYATKSGAYYTGTGWIQCGEDWYFAGEGGKLMQDELLQRKGISWYLGADGRMLVNTTIFLGEKIPYRAGADGVLSQIRGEWFKSGKDWYYVSSDGTLYQDRMTELQGVTYCFDAEGRMLKDTFFTRDGEMYFAAKNGEVRMHRGWLQRDGKWYFSEVDGTFYRSTAVTIKGQVCHFNRRGEWQDMDQYYTGIIEDTSYTEIDGRRYHVDAEGNIDSWFGIDVSAWNGVINWEKVAADGVDFAFVRAGGRFAESGELYEDSKLIDNVKGATAAGIPVGVYFFSQAITEEEAVEEALYTINRLKGLNIELPIIIDTEYKKGARHNELTIQQRTDVVRAFCETVEKNGYKAMYYAGMRWCEDGVDTTQLSEYMHWCAQWWIRNQCDDMGVAYQIWQYTDSGSVDGIKGDVDFSIWYRQN